MDVTDQTPGPNAEPVSVQDGAVGSANMNKAFRMEASVEKGEVTFKEESSVLGMISIRAPEASEGAARPALDLVVCMDRSGSMRGSKIKLVKDTLESLVKKTGLNAQDRLSIVSFDTNVATEMPWWYGRAQDARRAGCWQVGPLHPQISRVPPAVHRHPEHESVNRREPHARRPAPRTGWRTTASQIKIN